MRLNLQFPVFQMGRAREVVSVSCLLGGARDSGGVAALPGALAGALEVFVQSIPVFLPGESHRQRSLVGYSPQGCKELDTTEAT